jgi:SAM-dependent methyltransferase
VTVDRGDRLHPPVTYHAYLMLVRLREAMERMIAGLPEGAGRTVLDVGCGNKPYRPLFEARGYRYVGADLPGSRDADVLLDAEGRLSGQEGRHALACSSQVLEHVDDPRAYLGQLRDALEPGGRVVLSTHGVWPYHPDPRDLWRWTSDGLREELARAGLVVETLEGILGPTATGVQLVATSVGWRLGGIAGKAWRAAFQPLIALADRLDGDERRRLDAAVYVVTARASGVRSRASGV